MSSQETNRAVLVDGGDFGIDLFNEAAVELDDQGVAHNLVTATEYVVLSPEEVQAYLCGEVKILPDDPVESKFSVMFPGLDSFKTSITAQRT